jgi:hypothetical protein
MFGLSNVVPDSTPLRRYYRDISPAFRLSFKTPLPISLPDGVATPYRYYNKGTKTGTCTVRLYSVYKFATGRVCEVSWQWRVPMKMKAMKERKLGLHVLKVAAQSEEWSVFARSNTLVVSSNPFRCMDVCLRLFSVCAVLCVGRGLTTGWSPFRGVLPTVYTIKKLKKRPRPNKGMQIHNNMNGNRK